MKFILAFVFGIVLWTEITAQSVPQFSTPYPLVKNVVTHRVASNAALGVAASIKCNYSGVIYQAYDTETMKELCKVKLKFPSIYSLWTLKLVWIKDKLVCFYTVNDKTKKDYNALCYREVDYKTGAFITEQKQLLTKKDVLMDYNNNSSYQFVWNEDQSKLLIYGRQAVARSGGKVTQCALVLYLMDTNMKKLGYSTYRLPYPEKELDLKSIHLSRSGVPYLLCKVHPGNTTFLKKYKNMDYFLELYQYDFADRKATAQKIEFEDHLPRDVALFTGRGEQPIIAGYYSNRTDKKVNFIDFDINGFLYFNYNEAAATYEKQVYPVSREILLQYSEYYTDKKDTKKQNINQLSYLKIRKLEVQEDKSMVLIGEQVDIGLYDQEDKYEYRYHFGNILVAKIDETGQLLWMQKIPKRLKKTGLNELSLRPPRLDGGIGMESATFAYANNGNQLCFVFNDHSNNKTNDKNTAPTVHRIGNQGVICAVILDTKTGAMTKKVLCAMKENKLYDYKTQQLLQNKEHQLVWELRNSKKSAVLMRVAL